MTERKDASPLRAVLNVFAREVKVLMFGYLHDIRIECEPIVENSGSRYAVATLYIDHRSYHPLRIHADLDTLADFDILDMHTRAFVRGEAGRQACADFRIDADVLEGALVPPLLAASGKIRRS
jgi:hypothetical protein